MDGLFFYYKTTIDDQEVPKNLIDISYLINARIKSIKSNLAKLVYTEFEENQEMLDISLYTLLSGKTYYRSFFVEILGEAFGVSKGVRRFIGTILEIMHNSVIMENCFPEIDNSNYRHNNLSCHAKYGQTKTMIVSNILNSWCYQLIASYKGVNISNDKRCEIVHIISNGVGKCGSYGNQMMKVILKQRGIIYKDEIIRITKQDLSSLFIAGAECIFLLSNVNNYAKQQIKLYLTNLFNLFELYNNIVNTINITDNTLEQARIIKQQAIKSIDNIITNSKNNKKDIEEDKFKKLKDFVEYNYYNIKKEFYKVMLVTNSCFSGKNDNLLEIENISTSFANI